MDNPFAVSQGLLFLLLFISDSSFLFNSVLLPSAFGNESEIHRFLLFQYLGSIDIPESSFAIITLVKQYCIPMSQVLSLIIFAGLITTFTLQNNFLTFKSY